MRRVVAVLALLLLGGAAWLAYGLMDRPALADYAAQAPPPDAPSPGGLRVTFLGVASLLFDDGETAFASDFFVSRPGLLRTLARPIAPDPEAISRALERASVSKLAAVIAVHSHYDHAMDSPEVARRTGALLVGSESTAMIGRGAGLPEEQIRVVRGGETLELGRFRVTLLRSRHFPHGMAMGEIREPLVPPARATAYLEGGSFSLIVEHQGRRMLVQGSAGFEAGALADTRAEVVFLGMGGLGTKDDSYRDAYWRQVVEPVQARRVIPIHWDDFSRPLDEPLRPMPRLLDDFATSMQFVLDRSRAEGRDVRLPSAFQPFDPLAGL